MIDCPVCWGYGRIMEFEASCDHCNGTGKVKEENDDVESSS